MSHDSSVGIVKGYRKDDLGSVPGNYKIFLFFTVSTLNVEPTHPIGFRGSFFKGRVAGV
jgi:hypothetical protein